MMSDRISFIFLSYTRARHGNQFHLFFFLVCIIIDFDHEDKIWNSLSTSLSLIVNETDWQVSYRNVFVLFDLMIEQMVASNLFLLVRIVLILPIGRMRAKNKESYSNVAVGCDSNAKKKISIDFLVSFSFFLIDYYSYRNRELCWKFPNIIPVWIIIIKVDDNVNWFH